MLFHQALDLQESGQQMPLILNIRVSADLMPLAPLCQLQTLAVSIGSVNRFPW